MRAIELDLGGRRRMRLTLVTVEDKDGAPIDQRILMGKQWAGEYCMDGPVVVFSIEHVPDLVAALRSLAKAAA